MAHTLVKSSNNVPRAITEEETNKLVIELGRYFKQSKITVLKGWMTLVKAKTILPSAK